KEAAAAAYVWDTLIDYAVKAGEGIHKLEAPFLPIIAGFVAPIVAGLFGAEVDEGTFARRLARGGGAAAGASIVDKYIAAIQGETADPTKPSDAGSRRVAAAAVAAALESTFNAAVPELLSDVIPFDLGKFTALTEIPEDIMRALGTGRLTRRALAPAIDT